MNNLENDNQFNNSSSSSNDSPENKFGENQSPRFSENQAPRFAEPRVNEFATMPENAYREAAYMQPDSFQPDLADIGTRFVAALIDGFIVGGAYLLMFGLLSVLGISSPLGESPFASQLETILIAWLYEATMTSSERQGTFGKNWMGIKVTDTNGKRLSFARASGRHFAKLISAYSCLIGYIIAFFTKKNQALHDLIAGTLVVNQGSTSIKDF